VKDEERAKLSESGVGATGMCEELSAANDADAAVAVLATLDAVAGARLRNMARAVAMADEW